MVNLLIISVCQIIYFNKKNKIFSSQDSKIEGLISEIDTLSENVSQLKEESEAKSEDIRTLRSQVCTQYKSLHLQHTIIRLIVHKSSKYVLFSV